MAVGGQGVQQSWTPVNGTQYCYDVTIGLGCSFRCYVQLGCNFNTGSGFVLQVYPDDKCATAPISTVFMAPSITYPQAVDFFNSSSPSSSCIQYSGYSGTGSRWMKWNQPLTSSFYPDCSTYGSIAAGGVGTAAQYTNTYTLSLYTDNACSQALTLSEKTTNTWTRYQFKVQRGVQYCYDFLDNTLTAASGVVSSQTSQGGPKDLHNFKFLCGATAAGNGLGNGVLYQVYSGSACEGGSQVQQEWAKWFYSMNYPTLTKFFSGQCVQWDSIFASFDRAWQASDYPSCATYACNKGYCDGGPVGSSSIASGAYTGPIQTVKNGIAGPNTSGSVTSNKALAATLLIFFALACLTSA